MPSSQRNLSSTTTSLRPSRTATNSVKTNQKQRINLAGSTAVIADYFHYAINCILYQRAIYDQADFKIVKKFGLQMMLVEDESIAQYLSKIVDQVRAWLNEGKISRLALVILKKDTGETLERWEFDVHIESSDSSSTDQDSGAVDQQNTSSSSNTSKLKNSSELQKQKSNSKSKSLAQVQSEIQVIIRQIIATVSFLPIPDSARTFKVLAHTQSVGQDEATDWNDSSAYDITEGAERVKLKSFSTSFHRIDTAVDYKLGESAI